MFIFHDFRSMLFCFPKRYHEDMKSFKTFGNKLVLFSFILQHFGASSVVSNKNIPFCRKQWNDLANEMADWRERCVDEDHDINSPCCREEKTYFERRRRSHGKLCFFKGTK